MFYSQGENRLTKACEFIRQKIYLNDEIMIPWEKQCKELFFLKKNEDLTYEDLNQLQKQMDILKVSHLRLYRADEVQSIWSEKRKGTGIRAEYIDGVLLVTHVLPNSPAFINGVLRGDHILSINKENADPVSAQKESGEYLFKRRDQKIKIRLQAAELVEDQSPKVHAVNSKTYLLKIPSFRAEYFTDEKISFLAKNLNIYKEKDLILDLRKNAGGNFVAGLRFLAFFLCDQEDVGLLLRKTKKPQSLETTMKNDLDDRVQYGQIKSNSKIYLKVPASALCMKPSSIKILVDFETASTAEMVALALKENKKATVLGSLSAGQLLVGTWYPFQQFGEGVQISIPEAIYQSHHGFVVEAKGIRPDHTLYYEVKDFENGKDTWELKAVSF